jgi:hypothetical protein
LDLLAYPELKPIVFVFLQPLTVEYNPILQCKALVVYTQEIMGMSILLVITVVFLAIPAKMALARKVRMELLLILIVIVVVALVLYIRVTPAPGEPSVPVLLTPVALRELWAFTAM